MSDIFERDYQMLELDRDASWHDARTSYKRLVNRWHPDRFASRPREKQHAQTRFIEITKSYDNLRGFHRDYQRLPLQNPALQDKKPNNPTSNPRIKRPGQRKEQDVEEFIFATSSNVVKNPQFKYWLIAIPVVGLLITLSVFVVLERRLAQQQRAAAIDVLRETQPSEFMPDQDSMRRHSSKKAAFGNL